MNSPLPSMAIVTPSLNQGRYVRATIDSVLEQKYPRLEYLVMDGGSTDQTLSILRAAPSALRWVSQPDGGQSDAINQGFANTRGEILGWLNSDDTLAPEALRIVGEFFAAHPRVEVMYGNANFIDAAGRLIAPCAHVEAYSLSRLRNYSDFIVQPAAFFRRRAFEEVGGLDGRLHWAMDYDLWLKLARRGPFSFVPQVLANYRWLGDNKSGSGGGDRRIDEVGQVARRHDIRRLPAYFRLERVNLRLSDMRRHLVEANRGAAVKCGLSAAATLLAGPRACGSLLSPHTWRIIRTGQTLRAAAARG